MMTFRQWMIAVDRQVIAIAALSVSELTDAPFRDMYDDGDSPLTAAIAVLTDNDFPVDLLPSDDPTFVADWL